MILEASSGNEDPKTQLAMYIFMLGLKKNWQLYKNIGKEFVRILLGFSLSLEVRMFFPLGTGKAPLIQGFHDLFWGRRTGGKSE